MTRRIVSVLTCLLLVFAAAGCDFFSSPSASVSPSAMVSEAPSASPSAGETAAETTQPADEPTPTPTVEPTGSPATTPDSTEGMIFPDSDTVLVAWSQLVALNADKLGYAKNEIYARAGYKFTTKKYADYYGALSWYKIDPSFSQSNFSDIQWANIHLIVAAQNALAGQLTEVSSGTKLDYDQDGNLETLTVTYPDDNHAKVSIKDSTTTTTWTVSGDNIIKKLYIGDINVSDGLLDLFVGEAGPSDDYSVYIAGIKHHAFLQRGNIPGAINSGSAKDPFKPDGKGGITTLERMDTVGTDFFIVKYKLNSSGKLVFAPQSSYNFISFTGSKYTVKTKVALKLRKTNNSSSPFTVDIPIGATIQFVSTDAKKWVKITAPGGTGWLELEKPLKILDPNIFTVDAFDGLILAD